MPGAVSVCNSLRTPAFDKCFAISLNSVLGETSKREPFQVRCVALVKLYGKQTSLAGEKCVPLFSRTQNQTINFGIVRNCLVQIGRFERRMAHALCLDHKVPRYISPGMIAVDRSFVRLLMPASGTFRTCRASLIMSALRAHNDIPPQGRDVRF